MYNPDERYITIDELEQGTKFTYCDAKVMKLPEFCECYGHEANAINIQTGTMLWLNPDLWIDRITMIVEKD